MYDICKVVIEELLGEVIHLQSNRATIQVYEEIGTQVIYLLYNDS